MQYDDDMDVVPEWAARFQSKVLDLKLESGCLIWLGGTSAAGYGNFTISADLRLNAHRAAWLLEYGVLPDPDMVLDHLCRNRWCVNVAHLEEISRSENIIRGVNPTAHRKDLTLCKAGLHPWVESNLVRAGNGYLTCRECKITRQRVNYHKRKARQSPS